MTSKFTSPEKSPPPPLPRFPTTSDEDASPLHLHVVENARLVGKPFASNSRSSSRSRSVRSRSRSRSKSREPRSRRNSWTLEDIDQDILTDQKGHEELDFEGTRHASDLANTLPSLNERMSDEALEDCHAFSDLKEVIRQISKTSHEGATVMTVASSNASASGISSRSSENSLSREGSLAGGSLIGDGGHLLETLEEFEEEEEGSDAEGDEGDGGVDAEDEITVGTVGTAQTANTAQTEQASNTNTQQKKKNFLRRKRRGTSGASASQK